MSGELNLYYMRDNHTFRKLPHDESDAISIIREEFEAGWTHGMLCSKISCATDTVVHARGMEDWDRFEAEARIWLSKVLS